MAEATQCSRVLEGCFHLKTLSVGDIMSPCCWLLFLSGSERPRLSKGTSGHTNGSQKAEYCPVWQNLRRQEEGTSCTPGASSSSHNRLWSWPFAYAEKGTGAEARGWSAQGMAYNERSAGSHTKQQLESTKPLSKVTWRCLSQSFPPTLSPWYAWREAFDILKYLLSTSHVALKQIWKPRHRSSSLLSWVSTWQLSRPPT